MIVDLFAGPGGWDEGLRTLGITDVVGLEWDDAACDTAEAAGHTRHRVDVAAADPADYQGATGLIASPPCQAFSLAGKGAGRGAADRLVAHAVRCADGWVDPPGELCGEDVRADLTLQPLRWVDALRPGWVALEQVPPVLPLWQAIGEVLELWGYTVACAVLNSADYGVPQTRKRAVLLASRADVARLPEPTHFDPRKGVPLFGQPWVSMADALGWGYEDRGSPTVTGGGGATGGPEPFGNEARKALTAWVVNRRTNSKDGQGGMVPTVTVPMSRPSPTLTGKAGTQWVFKRPATTIVGSFRPDIVAAPGYRTEVSRQNAEGSVKITVEQAGVLQSFRPDYPWRGTKTKQYQQVGNAVPPVLAAAVLGRFVAARQQAA